MDDEPAFLDGDVALQVQEYLKSSSSDRVSVPTIPTLPILPNGDLPANTSGVVFPL